MKRHIFLYIITSIFLVGCSEMYDEALGLYPTLTPRYMTVTPTALSYSALPSSKSLQVTSTETPWEIENEIDSLSKTTVHFRVK